MKGKNDKSKSQGECNIIESAVVDKVTNPHIYNTYLLHGAESFLKS